jgi:asparagine synthase (glutamine-hydrolysing)
MCGINGFVARKKLTTQQKIDVVEAFENSSKRGRDNTVSYTKPNFNMTFSRLAIHDKTNGGNQPFIVEDSKRAIYVVANGEIYNYKHIISKYKLQPKSNSDCEIIPLLYSHFRIMEMTPELCFFEFSKLFNCELSFALYEECLITKKLDVYFYTDHCSIRPLFYAWNKDFIFFGSTLQSMPYFVTNNYNSNGMNESETKLSVEEFMELNNYSISRIDTGTFVSFKNVLSETITDPMICKYFNCYEIKSYIGLESKELIELLNFSETHSNISKQIKLPTQNNYPELSLAKSIDVILDSIYSLIEKSVIERLSTSFGTDAIGALLSGGVDSSIVCSIASKYLAKSGHKLHTFCIGMEGSKDIAYAKQVAEFIGSEHTSIELSEQEFLSVIPEVVRCIDSYDITSVRASVGQYLSARYISKNHPNIKILLCGDGADEVFFSYLYCLKAPTPTDYHFETCKLIDEIHHFDGRRADRCISNFNIEARFPFLSKNLIEYVLSLLPELRMPRIDTDTGCDHKWEKWILRKSAERHNLLPKSVLWRIKTAFSDGVSSNKKLWYKVVQDHIDSIVFDQEFKETLETYEQTRQVEFKKMVMNSLVKEYEPYVINYYIKMLVPMIYHIPPKTKEAYYYRKLYNSFFGNTYRTAKLLPKLWLPNWSNGLYEPSATALDVFKEN